MPDQQRAGRYKVKPEASAWPDSGAPLAYLGQGGTVALMNLLKQSFPAAQTKVCGVRGPK